MAPRRRAGRVGRLQRAGAQHARRARPPRLRSLHVASAPGPARRAWRRRSPATAPATSSARTTTAAWSIPAGTSTRTPSCSTRCRPSPGRSRAGACPARWRASTARRRSSWPTSSKGVEPATLEVRPLLAYREPGGRQRENGRRPRSSRTRAGQDVVVQPYEGCPPLALRMAGATWEGDGLWYRGFRYALDRGDGASSREDLFSPGLFRIVLQPGTTVAFAAWAGAIPPATDPLARLASERRRMRALGDANEGFVPDLRRAARRLRGPRPGDRPRHRLRVPVRREVRARGAHRPPRSLPGHGPPRGGTRDPRQPDRARGGAARRRARERRERRPGCLRHRPLVGGDGRAVPGGDGRPRVHPLQAARSAARDPGRLSRGHAPRRRRLAGGAPRPRGRCEPARPDAGRRRLGVGDDAPWLRGRGAGAVVQRAAHRRRPGAGGRPVRAGGRMGGPGRTRARDVPARVLVRPSRLSRRRGGRRAAPISRSGRTSSTPSPCPTRCCRGTRPSVSWTWCAGRW